MKPATQTPPLLPVSRRKRVRWLLLAIGVAELVVVPTFLHIRENKNGREAWTAFVKEAEARGESLRVESVIPPKVPDHENFATAPLFRGLFTDDRGYGKPGLKDLKVFRELLDDLGRPEEGVASLSPSDWRRGERTNMRAWYEQLSRRLKPALPPPGDDPSRDVMLVLEQYAPVMQQVEEAAARPKSRFPMRYQDGVFMGFSHASPMTAVEDLARLRASARLATGDTEGAYADVRLGLRLSEISGEVSALYMYVVGLRSQDLALLPVWEGLVDHRWEDHHLRELQEYLAAINHAEQFQQAMRAERNICALGSVDMLRAKPEELGRFLGRMRGLNAVGVVTVRTLAFFEPIIPTGWYDLNKAEIGLRFQQMLEIAEGKPLRFHPTRLREYKRHLKGGDAAIDFRKALARELLASAALPSRAAFAQGTVDLTLVALSLERHFLRHGAYPPNLEQTDADLLSTRGIPSDCVTGGAPHYRLNPTGTYTLYYEGWNARNDGGSIPPRENGRALPLEEGDWVWPRVVDP